MLAGSLAHGYLVFLNTTVSRDAATYSELGLLAPKSQQGVVVHAFTLSTLKAWAGRQIFAGSRPAWSTKKDSALSKTK